MKIIIYTLFISIGVCGALRSQNLPDMVEDSIRYLTPMEAAFMIDKETKYLVKINPNPNSSSLVGLVTDQSLAFAFEKKMSTAFSISAHSIFPQGIEQLRINENRSSTFFWKGGLEFRYYYQHTRLQREKKQANNLTGSYFGATMEIGFYERNVNNIQNRRVNNYKLTYGVQKRFLNNGFVDFTINLNGVQRLYDRNINSNLIRTVQNDFYISSGINAGIAFGEKHELEDATVCPIFKCYRNRNMAVKINLQRMASFGRSKNENTDKERQWFLNVSPNIIHEVKIAKSAFSFEQDLLVYLSFSDQRTKDKPSFGFNQARIVYLLGFKYYYDQKARIRKGESGNNLSGFYVFSRLSYRQYTNQASTSSIAKPVGFINDDQISTSVDGNPIITLDQLEDYNAFLQVGWGYQKEVLEHLFFDFDIGLSRLLYSDNSYVLSHPGYDHQKRITLTSKIKVGLLF